MRRLFIALFLAAACDKPGVAPGLDLYGCDGGLCAAPGVIQGSVVYAGTARGDAILLLFDTASLPPPDGTGSSAVAVGRVPEAVLFAGAAPGSQGPFSAPFSFAQVPAGRSYQVRALIDSKHEFDPFFDFTQSPRAGEPIGGYGAIGADGQPHLLAIPVAEGQVVSGVNVALTQVAPYDPPSFEIVGTPALDQNMDQPARLRLRAVNLGLQNATFNTAHFAMELSAAGRSTAGDGLPDVFPEVFLKQIRDESGNAVATGAIIPCRAISTPILPALLSMHAGDVPLAQDSLDLFVEPLAVDASLKPLPKIPLGAYQVIVVEKTGQVWTVPNSLGDPARKGTPFYAASQGATISVTASTLQPGSISGNVVVPAGVTSGNIVVQAYLDDPNNPPPPVGAALPVRVKAILGGGTGNVPYSIDGLPAGNYVVQALADADGNFSSLNLLQTPTKGDWVGAVIDTSTLAPKSITVGSGPVTGQDVTLAVKVALDAPAFEIAGAAQMSADSIQPARFTLQAKPFTFPMGASAAPVFTVALVRDAVTKLPVDLDGDGLPDVWPRVFLVRLDPDDPTGLTQFPGKTQVIPAAVDPTPYLPALLAAGGPPTVLASQVTVIARPALIDATNPAAKQRLNLAPGRYKVVVINQTGQIWQLPNEAASAGVASQGASFQVTIPASLNAGAIAGTLKLNGVTSFAGAYVFAYDPSFPPPPQGTGTPVSADYHSALEFSNGQVNYVLQNLPANRSYIVAAVVDTRGDFAVSPQLFAAAPGEGTVLGQHLGLVALSGAAPIATGIEVDAVASLATLPARPSFRVVDSQLLPLTADVAQLDSASVTPARFKLKPFAALAGVATTTESAPGFLVSYAHCSGAAAQDLDGDNLPDVWPRITLVKLAADGLTPAMDVEGNLTVIPAVVDPLAFLPSLSCTAGKSNTVPADHLDVSVTPAAVLVRPDGTLEAQLPQIPEGRYQIVLTSQTGQIWRIPNELQPSMLDAASVALGPDLSSQGVAFAVAPTGLSQPTGSISGVAHFNGYDSGANAPGNVIIAAYSVSDPPPALGGTGLPVASRLIPAPLVLGGAVAYSLPALPTGSYYVAALMDRGRNFNPAMLIMASPGKGAQSAIVGGATPVTVSVGSGDSGSNDLFFSATASPTNPLERPMFSLDTTAGLKLVATAVAGLPYTAGTPLFVEKLMPDGAGGFNHQANGQWEVSTKVVFQPLTPAQTCAPVGLVDPSAFCGSLVTGADGGCTTGTPTTASSPQASLSVIVLPGKCFQLPEGPVKNQNPSSGPWRVTAIERLTSGATWSVPNEIADANNASSISQGQPYIAP